MTCRPALLAISIIALAAGAAPCGFPLSLDEIDANASLVFIGSNPQGGVVDPNLGIAALIGVSLPLHLAGPFFFEPGLEFLGWYYQWNTTSGAAEITQSENGLGFFTIGALLSLQVGASFPLAAGLSMGASIGLDAFARFPAELQNTSSQVQSYENDALSWFYGQGRFFYPETRLFLRWHIAEAVDLLVNVRGLYPVFHLWDGSGQPLWDSLMVSAGVGFAIRLKPVPAGAAPASAPAPAPTPTPPSSP